LRSFADLRDAGPLPAQRQLYAWLIAPLQSYLTTRLVGIIPYGPLHYLPFAALSDGRRYFGEEHTLFYLPSASVLPFIQQKRKGELSSMLAVGQGQAKGLPALAFAEQEAQQVAALYQTQALVGAAATEAAFLAGASTHNILHLAAHAQLNRANPLFSRIVLAPAGASDGALEVHEIYGLDLQRADLVVLSACQTYLGETSAGDDIVGLNRAFLYAGAPTVIASLWNVDDQATSRLMVAFYARLRAGVGKAEALRAAQAEVRAAYPHFYYWAAFVLTGDPGPAAGESRPPAGEARSLLWAGAALAGLLLGSLPEMLRRR
jgi:CHAT domain-containing protein